MKQQKDISTIVQSTLITHFQISEQDFDWATPLHLLDANFKLYVSIEDLQQLLSRTLNRKVILVDKINGFVHTPNDIVSYINDQ